MMVIFGEASIKKKLTAHNLRPYLCGSSGNQMPIQSVSNDKGRTNSAGIVVLSRV